MCTNTSCCHTFLEPGVGLSRDELVSLVRGGAQYALAADSDDLMEAMPRMYFLAWGLEPFIPKVSLVCRTGMSCAWDDLVLNRALHARVTALV